MALCVAALGVAACDEQAAPVVDASPPPPPPPPPPREGCARVGVLTAVEADPSCVLRRVPDDPMRASMKRLAITVEAEPAEVFAGSMGGVDVTIRNTSSEETLVVFEAKPRLSGPRTDWSRVVGVPEPHAASEGAPRLFFPLTTTDPWDRDVDALPTVSGAAPVPPPSTALAVRLRPAGKLTHRVPWWALRIPAPAPMFQDDAGHRYYPKTAALPLTPGEYGVAVELPLWGLTREERKYAVRIKVTRPPKTDGGAT